jgi:hypothetical protein
MNRHVLRRERAGDARGRSPQQVLLQTRWKSRKRRRIRRWLRCMAVNLPSVTALEQTDMTHVTY